MPWALEKKVEIEIQLGPFLYFSFVIAFNRYPFSLVQMFDQIRY